MRSPAAFALFFLLTLGLHAQVRSSLTVESEVLPVKLGGKITVKLAVKIAPGWHIASTTQPDGGPVRTEIALAEKQPFKLDGPITGPKPHVEHSAAFGVDVETYIGTVVFTLPLVATEDIKPGAQLSVEITYQACNEETCLLPKTEKISCIIGAPKPAADIAKPPAEKSP